MQPDKNTDTGVDVIARYVRDMPGLPGVYRMLDAAGNVLYVGKAKHLKKRVSSYTKLFGLSTRIARMVQLTSAMEIVTTKTEAEALLLEANLIKRLMPRYNILLRDDKSFPYILITEGPYSRITKHRGPQKFKGQYFGPFASAHAVNQTITILQRAFLLRPCADTVFNNRTRPCLQYQIKRCSAPCVDYINETDYAALIEEGRQFLMGKSRDIQAKMAKEMQAASEAMDFEHAAELRDRIRALTQVQQQNNIHAPSMNDADVIALYRAGDRSCVQVFFFRNGQNFGNKSYFPRHGSDSTDSDILSAFVGQLYQLQPPPKQIILSHAIEEQALLEDALSLERPYQVRIILPQKGDKKSAMTQALANAKLSLERHLSEQASMTRLLDGVVNLFGLGAVPERIEVYDNSHIMGSHAVGGLIVAGPEGFNKKAYRKFNIKTAASSSTAPGASRGSAEISESGDARSKMTETITPGDDFGMMREVLTRRFSRLQQEDPERLRESWPNLVLIDGGAGQLTSATQVFEALGITDVPYVAISKGPDRNAGREWFHMPGRTPFQLPPNDPVLHYLQRLRDEAHRWAIGSHRDKRSRAIRQSPLDEIKGIGAGRKKALLHHFGSARGVETASLADLESVPGVNKKTAQEIYDFFRSR